MSQHNGHDGPKANFEISHILECLIHLLPKLLKEVDVRMLFLCESGLLNCFCAPNFIPRSHALREFDSKSTLDRSVMKSSMNVHCIISREWVMSVWMLLKIHAIFMQKKNAVAHIGQWVIVYADQSII